MKYTEVDKFVEKHKLLEGIENKRGIYAITLDDIPVYVGQSKWVVERLKKHIYNIQNGMLVDDYKYKLLLAAKLGGHKIRYKILEYCDIDDLKEAEDKWITKLKPCLNVVTPYGMQNIELLKIEDVIQYTKEACLPQTSSALGYDWSKQ